MRLVTCMEAVRERFSATNEQIFTWLQVPLGLVYAGDLAEWSGGIFLRCLRLQHDASPSGSSGVVVLYLVCGRCLGVVAGDFIQMLILMAIAIVTAILVLAHADIGGYVGPD